MIEKLKKRWGVGSIREVVIILVVFSITGFAILYVKDPFYRLLRLPADASLWIKIPLTLLLYQVLLLLVGACFGQFRFFWEKEKKLGRLLIRPFQCRSATQSS